MLSDVPLGAFLSGGIDSTIVVGLMAKEVSQGRLKTFSIGFEGDSRFNETAFAAVAAQRFKTDHTVFTVRPPAFGLIDRLVTHFDQPFGDSSALPSVLLSELARSQVTVALNGDGGDELFAGYERFRAVLLAESLPVPAVKLARVLLSCAPAGRSQRSPWARAKRFLEAAHLPAGERYLRWVALVQDPAALLLKPPQADSAGRAFTALNGTERTVLLASLLRLNFHEYLPNDLNVKMDRCSMARGLETRSPFLDTRLIEWAFTLPDALKLKGPCTKWILKHAFPDLLPSQIRGRGKMGFGVPLAAWFRNRWKEPLQELLGTDRARVGRYLRIERLQQIMQEHFDSRGDFGHILWLVITMEIWLRQLEDFHPERPQAGTVHHVSHSCSQV